MTRNEIRLARNEELVERFAQTAMIHRKLETAKKANRAFDEGVAICGELKRRGREAIDLFLTLLDAPNSAVRMNAAGLILLDEPELAAPVLQQLGDELSLIGFSARMTLKQWKAGELKPLF